MTARPVIDKSDLETSQTWERLMKCGRLLAAAAAMDANSWNAVFLSKGTPAPIVAKLNTALIAAMGKPEVQERLRQLGASLPDAAQRTPQYLQTYVEAEIKRWGAAIKAASITPE